MESTVYFTKNITPEQTIKLFEKLDNKLFGNIAVKLHSGEKGNKNYIRPEFVRPIIDKVGGTVIETNTAYDGARSTTEKHKKLLKEHGWSEYFKVDLLDGEGPDKILKIPNGLILKENLVGKNIDNYDSMLVLSHFKGHPCGGFGGALKQLSIGCASRAGKANIHSAGFTSDANIVWGHMADQDKFLESMADASSSVVKLFKNNILYINFMVNMSVDCDCCADAEDPCMKDIGILASSDPVAIDQACIDLVYNAKNDKGQKHLLERIESRNGIHTIESAEKLGIGSRKYKLISID